MNAASNLWQFRVGASKVEVLLYSKHDVQGLTHDWDTVLFGTSATLCVRSPYVFFREKLQIWQQSLKTL